MRDFQFPGRSPVHAFEAMAATPNPYATWVAVQTMRNGGNAIDAAVAAAAVLAVVEPHQTGIGGDCFALLAPSGGEQVIGYNGSGRAPAAANLEWLVNQGMSAIPDDSPHSVTIPGAVDAWVTLIEDYGRKSLDEVLGPAVQCATEGYIVHSRTAFDWAENAERLHRTPDTARVLLEGGAAPVPGTRHIRPALGATLRRIGKEGRQAFYTGTVAEDMVSTLRRLGGLHTLDDFADCHGEYVQPVSTTYRGYEILQMPPNNQGITALLMLNILADYDLARLGILSADRLHIEIEAGRLAYHARDAHVADPRFCQTIVETLLSEDYARALRGRIDPDRSASIGAENLRQRSDTVYLTVVDGERNVVSFINSIFHSFGSGILCPKSGVLFHNRGCAFRMDPAHPNCIGPGKRPMHTIMPAMTCRYGKPIMPFGVMGGDYQPFGHVHFLTNVIDFGLDIQEALDLGRVFHDGEALKVERSVPAAVIDRLRAKGHDQVLPSPEPLGGGQAIWINWDQGILTGASDPRMDGCALGY